jgi:hypothetical protein
VHGLCSGLIWTVSFVIRYKTFVYDEFTRASRAINSLAIIATMDSEGEYRMLNNYKQLNTAEVKPKISGDHSRSKLALYFL